MEVGKPAIQLEIADQGSSPAVVPPVSVFEDEVKLSAKALAPVRKEKAAILAGLKKHAVDAITSAEKAFQKYWELMVYIRDHEIPAPVVQQQLKAAGFHKVRVSEVVRVAGASEDIFKQYRSNAIGFRLALEMTREESKKKKPAQRTTDEDNFTKAIRHAVEDAVPLSGKFPAWAKKVTLEAQGCDVVVIIKRKA